MSMSTLRQQVDEKAIMQLSAWDSSGVCTHFPNKGELKVRRRRKRARAEGAAAAEMKKRRLSEEQVRYLEMSFWKERKLESGRKAQLAMELGIDPKQVAVWFQNRRARSKSKQLEEEYAKLKSQHESTVLQKCHLEAEVLNLKEQLSEAQKEIRKLSGAPDGFSCGGNGGGGEMSSSSPSTTSLSMDTTQAFHGGIGPEGEELVYINEYNTYVNMLNWMNLYGT